MKKSDFIEIIKEMVGLEPIPFENDRPRIRQLFNDLKDSYGKDNIITENQYQNWVLTDRELNKLLKIAKG